jgi:hypothetical protein
MVEVMMHRLAAEIPGAITIWLTLITICVAAFVVLARLAYGRPRGAAPRLRLSDFTTREITWAGWNRASPPASDVADARRYAEEIATAAGRAGVTAVQRRAEWLRAQQVMEVAWLVYENAESTARKAGERAAFPVLATPLTATEYEERERYLHRAAYAARLCGELSTDELLDALSHRNGFNPSLHPCQQDAVLARAARDRMHSMYQNAAAAERAAWYQADLAAASKQSLDNEAFRAALQARDAQRRFAEKSDSMWNLRIGRLGLAGLAVR